jgi:hypothetical protein
VLEFHAGDFLDETEAAGLRAVAPDADGGFAAVEGFDRLTAERGGRLLAGSERV